MNIKQANYNLTVNPLQKTSPTTLGQYFGNEIKNNIISFIDFFFGFGFFLAKQIFF